MNQPCSYIHCAIRQFLEIENIEITRNVCFGLMCTFFPVTREKRQSGKSAWTAKWKV